ncbi:MAG: PAS domain S-box protein [Granulosicoccus sp.]
MKQLLEKYKFAFAISPVPMLLVSQGGEIALVNDGLIQLFGYGSVELVGNSVEMLIPSSLREHHPQLRDAYFRMPTKRGMGVGRDLYGETKSGKVIPLELALEPVSVNGQTWAMVGAVDISQRKAHEERLRQAMDASASAMVMVDESGEIVLVNNAAIALFGYNEDELIGSAVERIVPEAVRRVHSVYLSSFMHSGVSRPMGQDRILHACHRDGTEIPVEIALTRVQGSTGTMVMSTIIDLSERVASERLISKKAQELEKLNVELSHYAYSASHDLKAPLLTIVGLLDACMEDLEAGDHEELLHNLRKSRQISERSAEKIEGVLRIARATHEKVATEEIELDSIIHEIWEDINGGEHCSIDLDLQHSAHCDLVTERPALQMILENLLSNALRYRDSGRATSTVKVTSSVVDNSIQIAVLDNGVGIPEDKHHLVFRMFQRLDARSADGLGLALVEKQVQRLGGTISLESNPGEGTVIRFTIPLVEQENQ